MKSQLTEPQPTTGAQETASSSPEGRSTCLAFSSLPGKRRVALFIAMIVLSCAWNASATNLISRPGAHNHYRFEVEPHLNIYGFGTRGRADVGAGVRISIPFMHNGPISSINNNLAISFGADTYFPAGLFGVSLPAAAQWNFYFTEIISVLGEVGIVINMGNYAPVYSVLDPYIQGGGRFQFGKVGVLVRVGYPSFSVGANFQF